MEKNKRIKNEDLKKQEELRKVETTNKILAAISKLKLGGKKINFSTIAEEANVSRNTVYTYRALIEEKTSLKVVKSNEVIALQEKVKDLMVRNKQLRDDNQKLINANQKLIEEMAAMKLFINDSKREE